MLTHKNKKHVGFDIQGEFRVWYSTVLSVTFSSPVNLKSIYQMPTSIVLHTIVNGKQFAIQRYREVQMC